MSLATPNTRLPISGLCPVFLAALFAWLVLFADANAENAAQQKSIQTFQYKSALQASQDAIGQSLGQFSLTDDHGRAVSTQVLLGKPIVISMVYTSCYKTCPMTIRHLAKVVEKSRKTLGDDSFSVVAIGFDSQYDTPQAMQHFARSEEHTSELQSH